MSIGAQKQGAGEPVPVLPAPEFPAPEGAGRPGRRKRARLPPAPEVVRDAVSEAGISGACDAKFWGNYRPTYIDATLSAIRPRGGRYR